MWEGFYTPTGWPAGRGRGIKPLLHFDPWDFLFPGGAEFLGVDRLELLQSLVFENGLGGDLSEEGFGLFLMAGFDDQKEKAWTQPVGWK